MPEGKEPKFYSSDMERRNVNFRKEDALIKDEIKEKLFAYYAKLMTAHDSTYPGHVLSWEEAALILGITAKELKITIRRAFKTESLNEVLEGMGLPHKPVSY